MKQKHKSNRAYILPRLVLLSLPSEISSREGNISHDGTRPLGKYFWYIVEFNKKKYNRSRMDGMIQPGWIKVVHHLRKDKLPINGIKSPKCDGNEL